MSKSIILAFCIFFFSTYEYFLGCSNYESRSDLVEIDKKQNIDKLIGACFLTLVLLNHCNNTDHSQDLFKYQLTTDSFARNFVTNYFMNFICTFFHELGHGIAKKILCRNDFKIHLGGNIDDQDKILFDSKYVSLHGLDPLLGFNAKEGNIGIQPDKMKKIIISASGGISGILANCLLKFLYDFLLNKNSKIYESFIYAISVDQIMVSQFLNLALPMQYECKVSSDAVKIWRELGINETKIKFFSDIDPFVSMSLFILLSFKQAQSNIFEENVFADKIFIGLANYFLQGFVQFKSA